MKREGVTMVLRVAAARLRRLHDAETAWAATTCDCHERTFLCTAWPFLCSHTNPQHRGFPFFSALATLQFNSKAPNKWLFTAWWLPMMAHQTSHASQWFRTELVCQTTTTTTTTTMRQQVAAECSGCMSLKWLALNCQSQGQHLDFLVHLMILSKSLSLLMTTPNEISISYLDKLTVT